MRGRHGIAWILVLAGVATAAIGCESGAAPTTEPPPTLPVVPVITIAGDPSQFILQIPHGGCGSYAEIDYVAPDLALVDRLIDAAGGRPGLVMAPRQAFFGPVAAAGAAFGGTQVVMGPRDAWIRTPAGATQLQSFVTPRGRTVWTTGDASSRAACEPG